MNYARIFYIPLLIAGGAVLGALCRYAIMAHCEKCGLNKHPVATAVTNGLAAFLIGGCASLFQELDSSCGLVLFSVTGFLASFSTFSTFQAETVALFKTGRWKSGLLYGLGMPILGFLLVEAGVALFRTS